MRTIAVTDISGSEQQIEFEPGASLMEVLRDNDYDEIVAICGGSCSCATCHVHITNAASMALPPIEEDEQDLLEMADNYAADVSRLSCQIELGDKHHGMQVKLVEPD